MNHRTFQLISLWLLFACPTSDAATHAPSFHLTGSMVLERPTFTNAANFEVKMHGREWKISTEEGNGGILKQEQHFDGTNLFHTSQIGADKAGCVAEAECLRFGGANIRILWLAFCSAEVLHRTNWFRAPWFPDIPNPGSYCYSVNVESRLAASDLPKNIAFSTSTARWREELKLWRGHPLTKDRDFQRDFLWAEQDYPEGVVQVRYGVTKELVIGGLHLPEEFQLVRFKPPGGEAKGEVVGVFRGKVDAVMPLLDTNLTLSTSGLSKIADYRFADASGTNLVMQTYNPKGWVPKSDPDLNARVAKERLRLKFREQVETMKRVWPVLFGPIAALFVVWLLIRRKKERSPT